MSKGLAERVNAAVSIPDPVDVNATIVAPLGQEPMVTSIPVVLASNQSAIPVNATIVAPLGAQAMVDSVAVVTQPADGPQLDAFSRKRVSNPIALSENSFEYDLNPLFLETVATGGATILHNDNSRSAIMTLGVAGPRDLV